MHACMTFFLYVALDDPYAALLLYHICITRSKIVETKLKWKGKEAWDSRGLHACIKAWETLHCMWPLFKEEYLVLDWIPRMCLDWENSEKEIQTKGRSNKVYRMIKQTTK